MSVAVVVVVAAGAVAAAGVVAPPPGAMPAPGVVSLGDAEVVVGAAATNGVAVAG